MLMKCRCTSNASYLPYETSIKRWNDQFKISIESTSSGYYVYRTASEITIRFVSNVEIVNIIDNHCVCFFFTSSSSVIK